MLKRSRSSRARRALWLLCAALWLCVPAVARQQSPQQPAAQDEEEVLRVSTSLVQTDVTVVDKQGRFVGGLRPEDFELKVDGKPQPLAFFEQVAAGGAEEARRIAAARGESAPSIPASVNTRGRSVIFFVDDVHLSPEGLQRTRRLLNRIIDEELTPETQALVVSPTGRVGFLQQFSNEKAVLRAAVARLSATDPRAMRDSELPPISFYQAMQVERGDRDMLEYLIQQTIYQLRVPRNLAEIQVRNRARSIRRQAALLSSGLFRVLENAASVSAPTPGRRLLYFISEGFPLDSQEGDALRLHRRVVDAAARTGTVIYTLDTRGLAVGMHDASSNVGADLFAAEGRAFSAPSPSQELGATQDILRSLAEDTGGRALLNTNALEAALARTLAETANYYLLAWRPEGVATDDKGAPRFRKVEVSVKGRPDVRARVRRGVFASRPPADRRAADSGAGTSADASKPAALNAEVNATTSNSALPVALYAVSSPASNDAAGQLDLTAFVQVDGSRLRYAPDATGRKVAEVELACVVFDERGKPVHSTGRRLTVDGTNAAGSPAGSRVELMTSFSAPALPAGLYQVRVAARDQRSGLGGGARQWAEVPDLKSRRLALGSLVLVESLAPVAGRAQDAGAIRPSASRVFSRTSKMLVELYIYNAAHGTNGPDLELSLRVLADGREALAAPPHKVSTAGAQDPSRVRYAAEVPLRSLAPGSYLIEIAVTDRAARTTATRQLNFAVE